jgi:hypothetical protein
MRISGKTLSIKENVMKNGFFRVNASRIDPPSLQARFSSVLKNFEVPQPELIAEKLFDNLRNNPASKCPFPLVTSPDSALTQAKKLRAELKSMDYSLGRCMKIFGEFWGYPAWQAFIFDVERSYENSRLTLTGGENKSIKVPKNVQ